MISSSQEGSSKEPLFIIDKNGNARKPTPLELEQLNERHTIEYKGTIYPKGTLKILNSEPAEDDNFPNDWERVGGEDE